MHPAYSVILFTTASGAGYGMLALLGLVGFNHGQASSTAFGIVCMGVALGLITVGLLASTFHLGHYVPLSWMTLGLDYLLWGMNPRGYHLTNLVLHAGATVMFYWVERRVLTRALEPESSTSFAPARAVDLSAAFAALCFSIHPLRVESVPPGY